jgi:hypothetical protein
MVLWLEAEHFVGRIKLQEREIYGMGAHIAQ